MMAIDRVQAECGAKSVTVRTPLRDGRVVYAAFVACDQDAAALRRVVRAVASSGPGASARLANLVTTDRRFALPYGGCGKSRREAIYWLERTIEIAVRKRGYFGRVEDFARDGVEDGGRCGQRQGAVERTASGALP